jgi:hypothetical protein
VIASIKRLKEERAELTGPESELWDCEFAHENSMIVLTKDIEGRLRTMKTPRASGMDNSILDEINILKSMNHPLVPRIDGLLARCGKW